MFFCPNCDNAFDITRSSIQAGGEMSESTSASYADSTDKYDVLIDKILKNNVSYDDIKTISLDELLKSGQYKKLSASNKEQIFNKTQDLLPKDKKKISNLKIDNDEQRNIAFFVCNNCGYTKKINDGTLILSRTSDNITQFYKTDDYDDMVYSDIIPRTRNYVCPNKQCETHKNIGKREAIFFRMNNSFAIKYMCTFCKTLF